MPAEPDSARPPERRRFTGKRLVIATHNPGKLAEFAALLTPCGVETLGAGTLGLAEPEETGASFADNAALKALAAARAANLPALADDSGLAVTALGGAPGLYSARWAGPEKDFSAAMQRIENELAGSTDRRAAFVCTLCLAWPDGHSESFEGQSSGQIVWPPRGTGGFGYDPIFQPEGESRSFAEMSAAEKHAFSHRARALEALIAGCFAA